MAVIIREEAQLELVDTLALERCECLGDLVFRTGWPVIDKDVVPDSLPDELGGVVNMHSLATGAGPER